MLMELRARRGGSAGAWRSRRGADWRRRGGAHRARLAGEQARWPRLRRRAPARRARDHRGRVRAAAAPLQVEFASLGDPGGAADAERPRLRAHRLRERAGSAARRRAACRERDGATSRWNVPSPKTPRRGWTRSRPAFSTPTPSTARPATSRSAARSSSRSSATRSRRRASSASSRGATASWPAAPASGFIKAWRSWQERQRCPTTAARASRRRSSGIACSTRRARGCDVAVVTTQPGSKSTENVQRFGFSVLYVRAILVKARCAHFFAA